MPWGPYVLCSRTPARKRGTDRTAKYFKEVHRTPGRAGQVLSQRRSLNICANTAFGWGLGGKFRKASQKFGNPRLIHIGKGNPKLTRGIRVIAWGKHRPRQH